MLNQCLYLLSQSTPPTVDASTTVEAAKSANWAEFGLAGLVILALFGVIFYLLDEHKSERKEWKSDLTKIANSNNSAIEKLTDSLNAKRGL